MNSAFISNGRIYITGGWFQDYYDEPEYNIYYSAKIKEDGSIGEWQISEIGLPQIGYICSATGFGGYIYALEDKRVFYSKIDAVSGDVEFWYEGPQLPEKVWAHTMFATRDVLYVFGGWSYDTNDVSDRIYYARINGDGSLGAWNTDILPGSRYFHDTAVRGRDIYLVDGAYVSGGISYERSIYRAPIAEDINVVKSWTSAGLNQQVLIDNLSLEAGRRYYFDVQATNGGNLTSAVGASDGILAGMPVPGRVENLVVGNPGCGETLVLNWTAVSGDVIGYNIYQSTVATAGYIKVNVPVVDNTYTVEALEDGTEYFYRVAAVDSRLREGAKSLPASGVPADELPPSAVADFQASASNETSITFCWTATGDNAISGDITGG
ncbi:MAG: fibronectin type III domain-containing protein, partial [Elusimicrobiota bacterium]|nr:fibronectin type III domain-containing protein [Elusimicrobiota bacterium]